MRLRHPTMVDSLECRRMFAVVTVTGTGDAITDDGVVTLREAITAINNGTDAGDVVADVSAGGYGTGDAIHFGIAASGIQTISPTDALPDLTAPMTIDGYTQPGTSPNTRAIGNDAKLLIEIDGTNAGFLTYGIHLDPGSGGSTIKGLVINRFGVDGIHIDSAGNTIVGNFIGTDPTGSIDRGNRLNGIDDDADGNTIGGTSPADRNVISSNDGSGIIIAVAKNSIVQGNYIGTNAAGTGRLANLDRGIRLVDAQDNTIGGSAAGAGNVISGNDKIGIAVDDDQSTGNKIQGNRIGTNAAGDAAIPNTLSGLMLGGPNTLVGGTDAGAGNVISGNGSHGVLVGPGGNVSGKSGNGALIQGNIIGLDATGTKALPNDGAGILSSYFAGTYTVGGAVAGARNIISGNSAEGIHANRSTLIAMGNYIGTDITGTVAVPNAGDGIRAATAGTVFVGGGNPGEGNLISGNAANGVKLEYDGATVQGNRIGVDVNGAPLGNKSSGVNLNGALNNIVGGSTDALGNVIAYNGRAGVAVTDDFATGNTIRHNSIFSNVGLGIDLGDADTGPNNLQNFPVLVSAANNSSGGTVVTGTINSTPDTTLIIDFYTDTNAAAEGKTFVGSLLVTTNSSGNASVSTTLSPGVSPGLFLTATASAIGTDPYDDTSEFSQPVQVAAAPPPPVAPTAVGYTNLKTAKLKGGKYAFTGVVASFTSTAFNTANSFSAKVNWGDGSTSAGQIVWNSSTHRWDVAGTHSYSRKGTYNLLITIVDANGKTATATSKITAS